MSDVLKRCKLKSDSCFCCDENHLCHALQSMTKGKKCVFYKDFNTTLQEYVMIYKDYDTSTLNHLFDKVLEDYNKTRELRKELKNEISDF